MSPGPLLLIARRHLFHNLFRTAISVGGVALGVTFMIAMSAMMAGFQTKFVRDTIESNAHVTIYDDFRESSDDFPSWASAATGSAVSAESVRPPERPPRIKKPLEILRLVRAMDGVASAAPNVMGSAILSFAGREITSTIVGIEPGAQEAVVATDRYMRRGRLRDLHTAGAGVVLGWGLAEKLGVGVGDTLNANLRTGLARPLRVVGVFRTGIITVDNVRAYVLLSLAQQVLGMGRDVNRIILRTTDYEKAREVAASIERHVGYRSESWQEANANFLSIFVIQGVITYVVTGGILIVAAFGILNVLIMLVLEKFPEIAMLKSIGYTERDITLAFLMEGIAIGLAGTAIGCVAGYHFTEFLGSLPLPMRGLVEVEHLLMDNRPDLYWIAGSSALACTMVASFLPALRAGRLDPVVILRGHA